MTELYPAPPFGVLHTSYYAKKMDIPKVGISLYPPKWFDGENILELAPSEETFKIKNRRKWRRAYLSQLDQLGNTRVRKILSDVTNGFTTPVALCCFEALKDPDEICHRLLLIEWVTTNLNIKISEYRNYQIYKGLVEDLDTNQAFVFGSNKSGFHGAGSAGYASFNVAGNVWRDKGYDLQPDGWLGCWNIKGCPEGYQQGTEGRSYAIPTIAKAGVKRSVSKDHITNSITRLYIFAASKPKMQFLVAYSTSGKSLSGYSPSEMAKMFKAAGMIPENIVFEEGFFRSVFGVKKPKVEIIVPTGTPSFIDPNISLEEETHTYTLATDKRQKFVSATTLLKEYLPEFDSVRIASNLVATHPKYKHLTVDQLLEQWGQTAVDGTETHLELELYVLNRKEPDTPKGKQGRKFIDYITGLDKYDIFPEVILYNTDLGVAGTVDILLRNRKDGTLVIMDWKCCNKLPMRSYRGKMMGHEYVQHLEDTKVNKYALQMSLYRYLLEEYYGEKVTSTHLLWLKPDTCERIECQYERQAIAQVINDRKVKTR